MNVWDFLRPALVGRGRKTALVYGERSLSYRELVDAVERAGETSGQKNGVTIAGESDRLEQALSVLRCFRQGKTVVPVSAEYGALYGARVRERVNRGGKPPEGAACVLFTSGSTGEPKGVALTHDNLVYNVGAICGYFAVDESDSILITRPLMHAAVLTGELLVSLYRGLTVHLYPEAFQPRRALRYIRERSVSVLCGTPTLLSLLCRCADEPAPLKTVSVSGECLAPAVAGFLARALPDAQFYSVYGLTEASPRVSALPPVLFDKKPGSVGYPLDGVRLKFEPDETDGGFPRERRGGDLGRLFIRSPGVMAGYWDDEALSKQKLAGGWLDTGDAAYRDRDGCLYIVGRADNMIIRGGFNIYPEEVESMVKRDPRVAAAVCYAEPSAYGPVVCLDADGSLTEDELKAVVRAAVPVCMRPQRVRLTGVGTGGAGKTARPGAKGAKRRSDL